MILPGPRWWTRLKRRYTQRALRRALAIHPDARRQPGKPEAADDPNAPPQPARGSCSTQARPLARLMRKFWVKPLAFARIHAQQIKPVLNLSAMTKANTWLRTKRLYTKRATDLGTAIVTTSQKLHSMAAVLTGSWAGYRHSRSNVWLRQLYHTAKPMWADAGAMDIYRFIGIWIILPGLVLIFGFRLFTQVLDWADWLGSELSDLQLPKD